MITEDLVLYIEEEQKKGVTKEVITSNLVSAGWKKEDVEEGFGNVTVLPVKTNPTFSERPLPNTETTTTFTIPSSAMQSKTFVDPYREKPVVEIEKKKEEFMPTLMPKLASMVWQNKEEEKPLQTTFVPTPTQMLNKGALLSSYQNDVKKVESMTKPGGKQWLKVVLIIIVVCILVAGGAWAYLKLYPKLQMPTKVESTVSVVKGPKEILGAVPSALSQMPAWQSYDLIKASSIVGGNNTEINIQFVGKTLYAYIPDLHNWLPFQTKEGFVVLNGFDVGVLASELPRNIYDTIISADKNKILYLGLTDDEKTKIGNVLTGAIVNANLAEGNLENLNGVSVHHYIANIDGVTQANIFNQIINTLGVTLPVEKQNTLFGILNSIGISSIDIWVGEKDNLPYKYTVNASMPFPQIFNTSGGTSDSININFTRMYYDTSSGQIINTPTNAMPIVPFVKDLESKYTAMYKKMNTKITCTGAGAKKVCK